MPKFRTKSQNSRMHGLASQCGLSHDDLREYADEISGGRTDHTSELYTTEADAIIHRLESVAKPKPASPRTVQYRRQKVGVKRIVSPLQTGLIEKLIHGRGISAEGERALCLRIIKKNEPLTTSDANKIIEALKAMNTRDKTARAFMNQEAA